MKMSISIRKVIPGILVLAFLVGTLWGCGTASPPAGIPAPVSQLMSISNPDSSGTVQLTGAQGSVLPGAEVSAANVSQGGTAKNFEIVLFGTAFADDPRGPVENSTIAGPDGSFELKLLGKVGDKIEVTQTVEGEKSPPTILLVEGDTVNLGTPPRDLAIDPDLGTVYVTAGNEKAGWVFALLFEDTLLQQSLPQPSFTFQGFPGVTRISLNTQGDRGAVIDPEESALLDFSLLTNGPENSLSSPATPLDVDILPGGSQGVLGLEDSTNALAIFASTSNPAIDCEIPLNPLSGNAGHVQTPLVQFRQDEQGKMWILAVSQFGDGSWVLSRVSFTNCSTPPATVDQIALPGMVQPGGLTSFNATHGAVVTDTGGHVVRIADFSAQSLKTVGVGNNPVGVAVRQDLGRAFVVNQGDNSISAVDLKNFSVTTVGGIGLGPTQIGLLPNPSQGVILSPQDNSVVLVDLNF